MQDEANKKRLLSIGEASEYLGVSIDTLRRWEKKGRISPLRSPGGHRYFSSDDLDALFGKRYKRDTETVRRTDEELGKTTQNTELEADEKTESLNGDEKPSPITDEAPQNIPQIDLKQQNIQQAEEEKQPADVQSIGVNNQTPAKPQNQNPPLTEEKKESPPIKEEKQIENQLNYPVETAQPVNIPIDTAETTVNPQNTSDTKSNENNLLSEAEIEKRIGTIIKSNDQKKSKASEIILIVFSSLFFIIDAVLLYLWATTSRIISPIP